MTYKEWVGRQFEEGRITYVLAAMVDGEIVGQVTGHEVEHVIEGSYKLDKPVMEALSLEFEGEYDED